MATNLKHCVSRRRRRITASDQSHGPRPPVRGNSVSSDVVTGLSSFADAPPTRARSSSAVMATRPACIIRPAISTTRRSLTARRTSSRSWKIRRRRSAYGASVTGSFQGAEPRVIAPSPLVGEGSSAGRRKLGGVRGPFAAIPLPRKPLTRLRVAQPPLPQWAPLWERVRQSSRQPP